MLSLLQAYGAFCSKASGSRAGRNLVGPIFRIPSDPGRVCAARS